MSNTLYYNGHLIDGCTAAQRGPLLPGLSAVCFVEVRGQQQYGHGSSSASNRAEAQAVVQVRPHMCCGLLSDALTALTKWLASSTPSFHHYLTFSIVTAGNMPTCRKIAASFPADLPANKRRLHRQQNFLNSMFALSRLLWIIRHLPSC